MEGHFVMTGGDFTPGAALGRRAAGSLDATPHPGSWAPACAWCLSTLLTGLSWPPERIAELGEQTASIPPVEVRNGYRTMHVSRIGWTAAFRPA